MTSLIAQTQFPNKLKICKLSRLSATKFNRCTVDAARCRGANYSVLRGLRVAAARTVTHSQLVIIGRAWFCLAHSLSQQFERSLETLDHLRADFPNTT